MTSITPQEAIRRRTRGLALQRSKNDRALPEAAFAVLSTFNVELLPPLLLDSFERIGRHVHVHVSGFGQISEQMLDPASELYAHRPDCVLLIPAVEDLLAPLFARPAHMTGEAANQLVETQTAALQQSIASLLQNLPEATCYLTVMGSGRAPAEFILSPGASYRGQALVERVLARLRDMGSISARLVIVDWDWHSRAWGSAQFHDDRMWYLARMRLNLPGLAALSDLVGSHYSAFHGLTRKVVVLDLDNTLWGGVVGEAGLSGIDLGEDGIGLAFQDLQRELLNLHDTGVLLTVASKNNAADALEVFDHHAGMILKREHLAAFRINWQDKASSIRELAQELNLGLESFVFLDDNPVEREWIRQGVPEVLVPELPADPVSRPSFFRALSCFQRITLTDADLQRAQSYAITKVRDSLRSSASSLPEFLASLDQEITIEAVHDGSLGRAAQMCQRTNQFNLTTQRYTVTDLEQLAGASGTDVYTLAVKDKFGDSGITGFAVLRTNGETSTIDSLLLSCRVLGRQIEDAFLGVLVSRARERGARYVVGRYVPTSKNQQVAAFYPERGFEPDTQGLFRLDLEREIPPTPAHISVKVKSHA